MKVAILGASDNPERYAYKAQKLLMEAGHTVFPVSPTAKEIMGISGYKSLADIDSGTIHTLTLYLRPERTAAVMEEIIALAPERVLFNPGTESAEISEKLEEHGIRTQQACTLVLLTTGQF
jgi:uncharacterized protein